MAEFVWKEIFNIGVDEIDSQHQSLLTLLNKCIDEAQVVNQKPVLGEDDVSDIHTLINELEAYANNHFKAEEKLMGSVNYPELKQQLERHKFLREQVEQLKKEVNNLNKGAINSMVGLLRDWYVQHIMDEDKRIGDYIRSIQK